MSSKTSKRRQFSSLLGLTLEGSRLEGVVVRKRDGLEAAESFSVALTLDPLTAAPELVGQEIRNHLDAAEIRERHCVVGVPLKWVLTTKVELPELPEADIPSFLQIEAERGFHADISTLLTCTSCCVGKDKKQHALVAGISVSHLTALVAALEAAKLKPVSFSLGIAALQAATSQAEGIIALRVGDSQVGLQITCGGGVAALRALEGTLETEGGQKVLHTDNVARETRITLGQLPADLREAVRRIRIFGPQDLARQLATEMEQRFGPLGLKVEMVTQYSGTELGARVPVTTPVSPAFSLAAREMTGQPLPFDFLPPKVSALQQLMARYSSGKLQTAGIVAALLVLLVAGLFGFQQWQLSQATDQWKRIASPVKELETVQQQIRQYRPWFDENIRGLTIMRQLTEAFPQDGVVTAKTVEFRDLNTVACTGTTRDMQSVLRVCDNLRTNHSFTDVKLDTIRGKSPMQFTFSFKLNEGGHSAN